MCPPPSKFGDSFSCVSVIFMQPMPSSGMLQLSALVDRGVCCVSVCAGCMYLRTRCQCEDLELLLRFRDLVVPVAAFVLVAEEYDRRSSRRGCIARANESGVFLMWLEDLLPSQCVSLVVLACIYMW